MTTKGKLSNRRKLTTFAAGAAAAVALSLGGFAVADSGSGNSASSGTRTTVSGKVIPFERGSPGSSKTVGQIPANWTPGSGTPVTGEAASAAAAAAAAAYPGGKVDRVVLLSNGEYNVHMIAVNWPHHVFVSQSFQAVGAE